jgi:hypothetical protein
MALASTRPLTEMSTKMRPENKPDSLTAICETNYLENKAAPTSQKPMGLHGLLQG